MKKTILYLSILISSGFVFRNLFKNFFKNFDESGEFVESELKLIKIENPIKIFENSMGKCSIKNFNDNVEIGSYIAGYYSHKNPTQCFDKDQFLQWSYNQNIYTYFWALIFSFLFANLFILIAAFFVDQIYLTKPKEPTGNNNKIQKSEKKKD